MQIHNKSSKPSKKRSRMSKWKVYRSIRSRKAWIIVVESQTLMSSWVLNRERSWLDFNTAKIGKSSSWHTVSQNSTVYVFPYVLRVENSESKALYLQNSC